MEKENQDGSKGRKWGTGEVKAYAIQLATQFIGNIQDSLAKVTPEIVDQYYSKRPLPKEIAEKFSLYDPIQKKVDKKWKSIIKKK